jgi:two-component system sensor histidine kinase DctS
MAWKRWSLWTLLVALVVSMLVTMVWLAGRYEASQVQEKLERDTANAVGDIRAALGRNLQDLLALSAYSGKHWPGASMRRAAAAAPRPDAHRVAGRKHAPHRACRDALSHPAGRRRKPFARAAFGRGTDLYPGQARQRAIYSPSRFQLLGEGLGTETMQVCMPLTENGHVVGYVLGTYSLQGILMAQVGKSCRAPRRFRSPSRTARVWPWWGRPGAARACSRPSSCWTCRATPWCCAWTAGITRPASFRM